MTQRDDDAAVDRLRKTFDTTIRAAVAAHDEVDLIALAAIGSALQAIAATEGESGAREVLLGFLAVVDQGLFKPPKMEI